MSTSGNEDGPWRDGSEECGDHDSLSLGLSADEAQVLRQTANFPRESQETTILRIPFACEDAVKTSNQSKQVKI